MTLVVVLLLAATAWQMPAQPPPETPLQPTIHAPLPQNVDDYWFAPRPADSAAARNPALAHAASAYASGNYSSALSSARQAQAARGPLEIYADYYIGASHLRLSNAAEADRAFDAVLARKPEGQLFVAALLGKAEAAENRRDHAAAVAIYERLAAHPSIAPDDVLSRLARASLAAGNRARAAEAWLRVYYEFPLSDAATSAAAALESQQDLIEKRDYKRD